MHTLLPYRNECMLATWTHTHPNPHYSISHISKYLFLPLSSLTNIIRKYYRSLSPSISLCVCMWHIQTHAVPNAFQTTHIQLNGTLSKHKFRMKSHRVDPKDWSVWHFCVLRHASVILQWKTEMKSKNWKKKKKRFFDQVEHIFVIRMVF